MIRHDISLIGGYLGRLKSRDLGGADSSPSLSGDSLRKRAVQILDSRGFEILMGGIILFNVIVVIFETDYIASGEEFQGKAHWTYPCSWICLAIFLLELSMRLFASRRAFWSDAWNIADFFIVIADLVFSIIEVIAESVFPVSMFRLFRLSKLARVTKLLRVFPELRIMIVGLIHSLRAIFWGTVLLGFFLLMWSVTAVLVIHPLNKDMDYDGECERCPRAYSSVSNAALTLVQTAVLSDGWGESAIPLMEKHPGTVFFFALVFLCLGLCVMNLMLAIIVTLAQRAYDDQMEEEKKQSALSQVQHRGNIIELCKNIDSDQSGALSYDEICAGFRDDQEFHDAMVQAGITEDSLKMAWSVMDKNQTGSTSYKDFVTFLFEIQQAHPHFMLAYIKHYINRIKEFMEQQLAVQHAESRQFVSEVEKVMERVEEQEEAMEKQAAAVEKAVVRVEEQEAAILEEEKLILQQQGEDDHAELDDQQPQGSLMRAAGARVFNYIFTDVSRQEHQEIPFASVKVTI